MNENHGDGAHVSTGGAGEAPEAIPELVIISGMSGAGRSTAAKCLEDLGRFVVDGFAQQDYAKTVGGAILVALLAIMTELVLAAVERAVSPRTASTGRRRLRRTTLGGKPGDASARA